MAMAGNVAFESGNENIVCIICWIFLLVLTITLRCR